jgi:hypothetical protein
MAQIDGPPANSIRNRAITTKLRDLLNSAADANGIQRVVIVSGGQTDNHAPHLKNVVGGWTGSRRHDNGHAADVQLIKNGTKLSFTNSSGSQVAAFITACAARGSNGIGAATDYMGPHSIHIGFGLSPSDTTKLTWGRLGASANAPMWLRTAANAGWNNPLGFGAEMASSGRSIVKARGGLWLRGGPGLNFDRKRLLPEGTALSILGLNGEWAKVDLEGDGLADGHVFAAFLQTADESGPDDGEEEMVDEAAVAALIAQPAAAAGRAPGTRRTGRRRRG